MKPLTIKQLYQECRKQINNGNGDKVIMISQDDEGNGYHYLWYSFTEATEIDKPFEFNGKMIDMELVHVNKKIAKKEDTMVLG